MIADSIAIRFAFVLQAKVYALHFSVLSALVKYLSEFSLWFKTSTISVRVFFPNKFWYCFQRSKYGNEETCSIIMNINSLDVLFLDSTKINPIESSGHLKTTGLRLYGLPGTTSFNNSRTSSYSNQSRPLIDSFLIGPHSDYWPINKLMTITFIFPFIYICMYV